MGVFAGGHVAFGLIEQDVDLLFGLYLLVVEEHRVAAQHFVSQFSNDFAVHRHYAGLNVLVGVTTRANDGVGEELVEANGLVGIVRLFFVVNALLARVETLGVRFAETAILRSAAVPSPLGTTAVTIAISAAVAVVAGIVAVHEARTRCVAAATRFVATLVATVFVAFLLAVTAGRTTETFARATISTAGTIVVAAVLAETTLTFVAAGTIISTLTGRVVIIIVAALAIIAAVASVFVGSAIAV